MKERSLNLYQQIKFFLGFAAPIHEDTGTPTLNYRGRKKRQPSERLHFDDFSPIQSLPLKALPWNELGTWQP